MIVKTVTYRRSWMLRGVGGDPSLRVQVCRLGDLLQRHGIVFEFPLGEAGFRRVLPARVLVHVMVTAVQGNESPPKPTIVQVDGLKTLLLQAADGLKHLIHDHPLVCWKLADLESAWFGPVGRVSWDRHLAVRSRLGDVKPRLLPLARRLGG